MNTSLQQRAVQLFAFLEATAKSRTKLQISHSPETPAYWFKDLPRHPGVEAKWEAGQEAGSWLHIQRAALEAPPSPGSELQQWLQGNPLDSSGSLTLKSWIQVPAAQQKDSDFTNPILQLPDHPFTLESWTSFFSRWTVWAEQDRLNRQVNHWYSLLFRLYQQQEMSGEQHELLVGVGLLQWMKPTGEAVERHLLYAPCQLEFDVQRQSIVLNPVGGSHLLLDHDFLMTGLCLPAGLIAEIEEQVHHLEDLWNAQKMGSVLRTWVQTLDPQGEFLEGFEPPSGALPACPRVVHAPALMLRKKNHRVMARRFQDIHRQLADGAPVPPLVARLLELQPQDSTDDKSFTSTEELYFPLPFNREQQKVIPRLSHHPGVVVKGPPGTGKSHTIANLVTHFLAQGQKVLVTSHNVQALKGLQPKIPKEVAPLCGVHLRDGADARKSLERSIKSVQDRHHQWEGQVEMERIADLERQLETLRHQEKLILQKFVELRRAETTVHHLSGFQGTMMAMAQQLGAQKELWFPLKAYVTELKGPLNTQELSDFVGLLRADPGLLKAGSPGPLPDLAQLLEPHQWAVLFEAEKEAEHHRSRAESPEARETLEAMQNLSVQHQDQLLEKMQQLVARIQGVLRSTPDWVHEQLESVLRGSSHLVEESVRVTAEILPQVQEFLQIRGDSQVEGLPSGDPQVAANLRALKVHLEQKGGWGFAFIKPRPVQQAGHVLKTTRVDGEGINTLEKVQVALAQADLQMAFQKLKKLWAFTGEKWPGSETGRVQYCLQRASWLKEVLELRPDHLHLLSLLEQTGLDEPDWFDPVCLQPPQKALELRIRLQVLQEVRQKIDGHLEQFRRICKTPEVVHPICAQLLQALESRDIDNVQFLHAQLPGLIEGLKRQQFFRKLQKRLTEKAPALMRDLQARPHDPLWDSVISNINLAHQAHQAEGFIRKHSDPVLYRQLEHLLRSNRQKIQDLQRARACAQAWQSTLQNLTHGDLLNLGVWQAMENKMEIDKEKPFAAYQERVRNALQKARAALPAWIMPVHAVAEIFEVEQGMFDVVIVDEASQSGLEALFLLYLGKKVIVLGDSEQTEPVQMGWAREDTFELAEKLVPESPVKDLLMEPDTSLFDLAQLTFLNTIGFQEHFRCMPEIIAYSNKISYADSPLIPLRQYGMERLRPLHIQHVPGAHAHQGMGVNEVEAEAIVETIIKCCADPAYTGKTFGVISLIGEMQADLIRERLLDMLGAEEMERRRLLCGKAASFQGDEWDVVFLSIVTPPRLDRRIASISTSNKKMRAQFNVAASRARDQMWVFHSIQPGDLYSDDIRSSLLQYCNSVGVHLEDHSMALERVELERQARDPGRSSVKVPEPFESWFELDIYLRITGRSYRVLPRQQHGQCHFDLMVEGSHARLAVECEGDDWKGDEAYLSDLDGQKELEKVGLTFWRIRGSEYYLNPEVALSGLWNVLTQKGIFPVGPQVSDLSREEVEGPQFVPASFEDLFPSRRIASRSTRAAKKPSGEKSRQPQNGPVGTQHNFSQQGLFEVQRDMPPKSSKASKQSGPQGFALESRVLPQHSAWQTLPQPHPAKSSREQLTRALIAIVRAECPVLVHRVYRLYCQAAGIPQLTPEIKSYLNKALFPAVTSGSVLLENEWGRAGYLYQTARVPGKPKIKMRERGTRESQEIPPAEVAALVRTLNLELQLNLVDSVARTTLLTEVARLYGVSPSDPDVQKTFGRALILLRQATGK